MFEAGEIAKKLKKQISVSYKSKYQPVTNADIEIDNYLRSFFKMKTPDFGWVSEETTDDFSRLKSDYFWCLDQWQDEYEEYMNLYNRLDVQPKMPSWPCPCRKRARLENV